MRVLFCDNGIHPFWNFRIYVARHFHEKGWNVDVALPESFCDERTLAKVPDYVKVHKLKMNRNGANPLSDLYYYRQLYKLTKKLNPDIIFAYTIKPNIYGTLVANKLHIPIVTMVAGLGYAFSGNKIQHRLGRKLYKFALNKAQKVIVLNQSNYETLRDLKFAKEENIILFRGGEGVNLNQFPKIEDSYNNVRFLMVARVLYDKGYSEYVEAARIVKKKYPDIKVELLGPLAEESPMGVPKSVVDKDHASGAITYLGETDDVTQYIKEPGTVIVVVSSYNEGCNRSLMEATAMGRVAITSNIPGCKDIIEDNVNGILVTPKNSEELADAMTRIIEMTPQERKRMATNTYQKACKIFDVKHILKGYDDITNEVMSNFNR